MTTVSETSGRQSGEFLHDRPVGISGDFLWKDSIIRQEISDIAQSLVNPLLYPESRVLSSSITFAINGQWGMGKSSALQMIKEEAVELAKTGGVADRLKFCEYIAPAYETLAYDARTTMALRILAAVAGGPAQAIERFLPDALIKANVEDILPPGEGITRTGGRAYALETVAINLARLIGFDQILVEALAEKDGQHSVLVVLIDDLDRCQTDFIWKVLEAIQQLSDISNLFFILAVEQERLRKTVEERFERTGGAVNADFALEKYIQHSVSVPDMNAESLKSFVQQLMQNDIKKGLFADAIIANINFMELGLRVLTPRSVKRCLNTIRTTLEYKLKSATTAEEQQGLVKERLLEYSWPNFYRDSFLPALEEAKSSVPLRRGPFNAFRGLEDACRNFHNNDDEELLRFNLKRLSDFFKSDRFKANWETLDIALVRYLGVPPYWFIQVSQEATADGFNFAEGEFVRAQTKKSEVEVDEEDFDLFSREEPNLQDEFMRYYLRSEAAEAANNRIESLQNAVQLGRLVEQHREAFGPRQAPLVGNVAINAERFAANELATRLYELALELDPEHSNNIQNFVDFIVKVPLPDLYDTAEMYLEKLKTGKHAQHRPERTLTLEARLNALRQRPDKIDEEVVNQFVRAFLNDPNDQGFTTIMSLLNTIGDYDQMRKVARAYYQMVSSEKSRYLVVRSLADALAASPSESNELEAMEMYSYMLRTLTDDEARADFPDIKYNYATLLYKHDYDDEAGRLWFDAYNAKLNNANIRRAYSLYLLRAGRSDLAQQVTEGEPVTEMALQPVNRELPEHFVSENFDRWWEQ